MDVNQLSQEAAGLYRFALSITRDPHRAADLVQDTFVRALERLDQFRGESSAGAWMRSILHNLAVDRARRAAREMVVERVEDSWAEDAYTVDPEVVVERADTREDLEDALARLPFIYRVVVILHDVEGFTVREIAELQDVSLPAAKQRLRRGRMALVSALADGHERRIDLQGVPLRCWEARQHVSDYLDGALPEEKARAVERHLEGCPTCPPLYAALVGVHDRLGAIRDPNTVVPPRVEERISVLLEA
jgi:RNA polymerase sigma-70 factor (ECF subfamily)